MLFKPRLPADLAAAITRWRADPMAFRREAIILEDGRRLGDAMDPWQAEDFAALDDPQHQHAYLERPRGHSKTADIGTEGTKELFLGAPNRRLFCAAFDEQQARLLFEDVAGKIERNPILRGSVTVTRREIRVKSTGTTLTVLNSDAAGQMGLRPDWIAVDEIAEWVKRGVWDALWTATGKRRNCRVIVISTAGWDKASLAWEVREIARSEGNWYFMPRGQCASWIDPKWLAQQRRTLPAHVFARLHDARWVDGVGAFLTSDEVEAVFDGIPSGSGDTAIGLDIGLTRDRTVAAVVRNVGGLVAVLHLVSWQGKPDRKVDLEDVEQEVKALATHYGCPVYFDPFQGVQMGQRLNRQGVQMKEFNFTGESRKRLFGTLLDLVRTRRLKAQPHEELRRELLGLEVQETASGWRVDHKSGRHDDHVVAVGLAAQAVAGDKSIEIGPEDFFVVDREQARQAMLDSDLVAGFLSDNDGPSFW